MYDQKSLGITVLQVKAEVRRSAMKLKSRQLIGSRSWHAQENEHVRVKVTDFCYAI